VDTVRRSILAIYPQAEVTVKNDEELATTSYQVQTTQFSAGNDYFVPLSYATDHKSDPLSAVVGAMANLDPGELIIYQVRIVESRRHYSQEGFRKIKKSIWPMLVASIIAKAPPQLEPQEKFDDQLQRMFEQKLYGLLYPVELSLTIAAASKARHASLLARLVFGAKRDG
jgi:hypothetical protein